MLRTPSPRVMNIARALEDHAAEAEGLSNRLRACGHPKEAARVFNAGRELVTVAKSFLGTSEAFNLFFHKAGEHEVEDEEADTQSVAPASDGAVLQPTLINTR